MLNRRQEKKLNKRLQDNFTLLEKQIQTWRLAFKIYGWLSWFAAVLILMLDPIRAALQGTFLSSRFSYGLGYEQLTAIAWVVINGLFFLTISYGDKNEKRKPI